VPDGEEQPTVEQLSIGHLSNGIDVNKVKVTEVLSMDEDTLNLIRDAVNEKNVGVAGYPLTSNAQLTIGHVAQVDPDYIKLSSVINYDDSNTSSNNTKMWKILLEGSGKNIRDGVGNFISDEQIKELALGMTVNELNITVDGIYLSTVMDYSGNEKLFNILCEAVGGGITANKLTIAHLSSSGFDVKKVSLSTVMPEAEAGDDLKSLLKEAYNKDYGNIKVSDLSSFSLNEISLGTVMKGADSTIKNILEQAYYPTAFDDIKLVDLGNFDISKVKLSTVLPRDSHGNLSIGNNKILETLVNQDVTVGGLGNAINELSLYDVYGSGCFVQNKNGENSSEIVDLTYKFVFDASLNAFVHSTTVSDEDAWYIHKNDGIWLLLCFTAEGYNDVWNDINGNGIKDIGEVIPDVDGRPEKYVISDLNLSDLEDATVVRDLLTEARMQQFVDAGILNSCSDAFKNLTLDEVVNPV
jgi:hypothetical protein